MSEELDELASAYIDGEATSDEAARVESTPELLDLVDELRSVRASSLELPYPEEATKERHLAAALAAFDEQRDLRPSHLAVASSSASFPHDDRDEESESDAGETTSTTESNATVVPMRPRTSGRTPPAWMVNAAAALVVVGGVGFALTQLPSGSDETVADSVELSEADGDAESFDAASSSNAVTTTGALERAEALVDESFADADGAGEEAGVASDSAASEDDAIEDDAEAAEEDSSHESQAPVGPLLSVAVGSTASDVLLEFDLLFDDDVLTPPPHRCQDVIGTIMNPSGGTVLGYAPVEIGGDLTDLVVFDSAGQRRALLLDSACDVVSSE